MSFNYSPDLTDAVSRVRQMIGDTVSATHQIEDETIEAYLTSMSGNERAVAIQLAWDLEAKWAAAVDTEIDGQQTKSSQMAKQYRSLAERLTAQGRVVGATEAGFAGVYVTGVCDTRGPSLTLPDDYS